MNELLLIEMLGELNPELLNNNIIEKDLKRGKLSLFKKLFMKDKWNDNNDFPINKSYTDMEIEEQVQLLVDTVDSIKIEDVKYDKIDTLNDLDDSEMEDRNSLFNISIFKKSFKNLIKIISGITVAFCILVGIIILIFRLLLKKDKSSSFIRRKIQISY